jgi:hypothetical protein
MLLLLLAHTSLACGQIHTAVSAERMNIVYVGLPNPLKVVAEGVPCKSLWLTTNNGSIQRTAQCWFNLYSESTRPSTVYVCRLRGKDTLIIDLAKFRTLPIPAPIPTIAGKHGGSIPLNVFRVQLGVANYYTEACGKAQIKHFTMILLRNSGDWKELNADGPYFTQEMKAEIDALKKGDRVFLSNIEAKSADGSYITLEPFLVTIE